MSEPIDDCVMEPKHSIIKGHHYTYTFIGLFTPEGYSFQCGALEYLSLEMTVLWTPNIAL